MGQGEVSELDLTAMVLSASSSPGALAGGLLPPRPAGQRDPAPGSQDVAVAHQQ